MDYKNNKSIAQKAKDQAEFLEKYTDHSGSLNTNTSTDMQLQDKDLEMLNKIKKSIWKSSDDCYYLDICITPYNENKDIYYWLQEQISLETNIK